MRQLIRLALLLSLSFCLTVGVHAEVKAQTGPTSTSLELVMTPGTSITATTPAGTIEIIAIDLLTRTYRWNGCERTERLSPRRKRWYGSLGAYSPGIGNHWRPECDGITRGVLEEGQQHFQSVEEFQNWMKERYATPTPPLMEPVFRNDGLLVVWQKNKETLLVDVWQIFVGGNKPSILPGAQDGKITMKTDPSLIPQTQWNPEVVMTQGMEISAETSAGRLQIKAGPNYDRTYILNGQSTTLTLIPRKFRAYGSLGLHFPADDDLSRLAKPAPMYFIEEGQQEFSNSKEAQEWFEEETQLHGSLVYVRNSPGILLGWAHWPREQDLCIRLWRVKVADGKQDFLGPAQDEKISVKSGE